MNTTNIPTVAAQMKQTTEINARIAAFNGNQDLALLKEAIRELEQARVFYKDSDNLGGYLSVGIKRLFDMVGPG